MKKIRFIAVLMVALLSGAILLTACILMARRYGFMGETEWLSIAIVLLIIAVLSFFSGCLYEKYRASVRFEKEQEKLDELIDALEEQLKEQEFECEDVAINIDEEEADFLEWLENMAKGEHNDEK